MLSLNDNKDEIKDFLKNLIRVGKVSSVDYQRATARVVFPDDDDIVSYDLPVLHRNAVKNKDYNMPDINERVVCLFLPSGVETGFILGSIYTKEVLPPETSGNFRTVVFDDGTRVRYDREKHQFTMEIEETKITANRQDVIINTPNSVNVTTASNATVNAPSIVLNGDVEVTGTLTAAVDVLAQGISLVNHTHTGNQGIPTSPPN